MVATASVDYDSTEEVSTRTARDCCIPCDVAACDIVRADSTADPEDEMSYYDLGTYSRKITTRSPEAQTWFDRGLIWVCAYNHEEGIRCFKKALEHDPDCAMAHWGVSYASGPNYNLPWELLDPNGRTNALAASYDAMQKALACAAGTTPMERALIGALPVRYPQRDPIEDMSGWNKAFTKTMRGLFGQYPADLDVRCVFVEAIMNETPW